MLRLLAAICDLDRLLRFHQVGFVAVWPLLGYAAVATWSPSAFIGLFAAGLFFNIYGVVINDVVHLRFDRHDPLKQDTWLVREVVSVKEGLAVGLVQIPFMAVAHVLAHFPMRALPLLMAAVVGQGVYNVFGKRFPVPPLMEAFEAGGASFLVLYGAAVAGRPTNTLVLLTAAAGAAFVMLVNAFHGCLRDIEVELRFGQRTTPIWMKCRGIENGIVHISKAMSLYGGVWQVALLGLSIAVASITSPHDLSGLGMATVAAASVANMALFVALHRVRKPTWDVVMRFHVLMLMVPLLLAFLPLLAMRHGVALFLVYLGPTTVTAVWWWQRQISDRTARHATNVVTAP